MARYAVIDIETSGSDFFRDRIIEIAVVLHNGKEIVEKYNWLLNPECKIPAFIQNLTGITDNMVIDKPTMPDVAEDIFNLIKDKIFVAHNVNFDYSFLKYEFKRCGIEFESKKLCTVKLSKKILPGLAKYGLSYLSEYYGIENPERHRALGDAVATAKILSCLLKEKNAQLVVETLLSDNAYSNLPEHLNNHLNFPEDVGVLYLLNKENKVIYVSKAINIRDKVLSIFSDSALMPHEKGLLNETHSIKYELTASKLIASILEKQELKINQPFYNKKLKKYRYTVGLYFFKKDDFFTISVAHLNKSKNAYLVFQCPKEAYTFLISRLKLNNLCLKLAGIVKNDCTYTESGGCMVCFKKASYKEYNEVFCRTFGYNIEKSSSFALISKGRNECEQFVLWVEGGKILSMGFIPDIQKILSAEELKLLLKSVIESYEIQNILKLYLKNSVSVPHPTLNVFTC
jgi:DNA polymerase-3 subunit epsilon